MAMAIQTRFKYTSIITMEIECWSIKGALIANILHGIYAVYDDTKNGPPLKRVPTAAAAAAACCC